MKLFANITGYGIGCPCRFFGRFFARLPRFNVELARVLDALAKQIDALKKTFD